MIQDKTEHEKNFSISGLTLDMMRQETMATTSEPVHFWKHNPAYQRKLQSSSAKFNGGGHREILTFVTWCLLLLLLLHPQSPAGSDGVLHYVGRHIHGLLDDALCHHGPQRCHRQLLLRTCGSWSTTPGTRRGQDRGAVVCRLGVVIVVFSPADSPQARVSQSSSFVWVLSNLVLSSDSKTPSWVVIRVPAARLLSWDTRGLPGVAVVTYKQPSWTLSVNAESELWTLPSLDSWEAHVTYRIRPKSWSWWLSSVSACHSLHIHTHTVYSGQVGSKSRVSYKSHWFK